MNYTNNFQQQYFNPQPQQSNSKTNSTVQKGTVKLKKCPRKNYYKDEEDYIFLQGTVRPPFNREREFNMAGVT